MNQPTHRPRSMRRLGYTAIAACTLLAGWAFMGPAAQAKIVSMLASPTAVATIDIDAVLSQLDERAELEAELVALGSELENEVNALKAEADGMMGDIELFEPGSDEYNALRRKIQLANANWRLRAEFATNVVSEERSALRRNLFNKIMDSTRVYAEREGWDIVLVDDSSEDPNNAVNDQQFSAFIATRSVAYRADGVDITDAVATMLNNAFRNNVNP